jgi:hypothetical protein
MDANKPLITRKTLLVDQKTTTRRYWQNFFMHYIEFIFNSGQIKTIATPCLFIMTVLGLWGYMISTYR